MEKCYSCPRNCGVDRHEKVGFCGEKAQIRIAKVVEHFSWEEPCLADEKGTLAIFFSGCNLKCSYCQNIQISRGGVGQTFSIEEFCALIEEKQKTHSSIDLITPTHFEKPLSHAFAKIEKTVPIIWNTSGYESLETIENVSKFVDAFLTDLKYGDNQIGKKFSKCEDYFSTALPAIKLMCDKKKDVYRGSQLVQGVIIRHLVLPNEIKNSFLVLDAIKEHFPDRIVSLMSQFTPNGIGEPSRKLTKIEYKAVLSHMQKLGLSNGFTQTLESASCDFVPDFS